MKIIGITLLFCVILSVNCSYDDMTVANLLYHVLNPDMDKPVDRTNDELMHRFMVIGDFGDILNYYNLNKVGNLMNDLANKEEYEYIITVGDNFYANGIRYIWFRFIPWLVMTAFKKNALKDVQFYPTMGNHDGYSDMNNELDFTHYDPQWNFTEDYYVIKRRMPDGQGKYFVNLMLNTCKLYGPNPNDQGESNECSLYGIEAGGPDVVKHYKWIEEQLQQHSTDPEVAWLAVTLHHPVFTKVGLKNYLLPLLRKYAVDFIFVGHEHYIEYTNMDVDYEIRYPNSGNGPVLNDGKDSLEIMTHPERIQEFLQGDKLHYFLVGNGGAHAQKPCPLRDQDGEVYFRNMQGFGAMKVEVNSTMFSAQYLEVGKGEVYRVNVYR